MTAVSMLGGLAVWQPNRRPAIAPEKLPESLRLPVPRGKENDEPKSSPPANYVGVETCAECHAEQDRTYRQTAHSLALAEIDSSREPPDASFYHQPSGRTYTVYRDGDEFRHREAMLDESGAEIAAADYAIRYLIGSGRHARSYLVDIDGFLCESPLTWYASRQAWGMSPGYDHLDPRGFERAADSTCLFCHVGQVADGDRTFQRLHILEQPIGCERCHGPGEAHVAEQRGLRDGRANIKPIGGGIVNPARLSRDLAEAVCAQCHLDSGPAAIVAGRALADFRPGLPLTDFCINYRRDGPGSQMTIVGHVEQMRLSRCYQASDTLTCTTCHDPHADMEPAQQHAHFIAVCQSCHDDRSCGLARDERLRHPSGNDCLACHMPQVDSEIPHVAFTQHRIGIQGGPTNGQQADGSLGPLAELVPLDPLPYASEVSRERDLGLAYFSLAREQTDPAAVAAYGKRARRLLEAVRSAGAGHREVAAALVRIYRERDPETALRLANEALTSGGLAPKSRVNCLFFIGEYRARHGQFALAQRVFEKLTELRLLSEDWFLLGLCRQQTADLPGARAALERASRLAPLRPEIHNALAEVYQRLGEREAAAHEQQTADRLIARLKVH